MFDGRTPRYSPPEANNGRETSEYSAPAHDAFSLGYVLFELRNAALGDSVLDIQLEGGGQGKTGVSIKEVIKKGINIGHLEKLPFLKIALIKINDLWLVFCGKQGFFEVPIDKIPLKKDHLDNLIAKLLSHDKDTRSTPREAYDELLNIKLNYLRKSSTKVY